MNDNWNALRWKLGKPAMSFADELFAASEDDQASSAELRALLRLAAIRIQTAEFELSHLISDAHGASCEETEELDAVWKGWLALRGGSRH